MAAPLLCTRALVSQCRVCIYKTTLFLYVVPCCHSCCPDTAAFVLLFDSKASCFCLSDISLARAWLMLSFCATPCMSHCSQNIAAADMSDAYQVSLCTVEHTSDCTTQPRVLCSRMRRRQTSLPSGPWLRQSLQLLASAHTPLTLCDVGS